MICAKWYTFFMAPGEARQQLLDDAIDYVAEHGLTDLSLRGLAAELGTSHRMLSHHFGSKEGLWVAIIREVEQRNRAAINDVTADSSDSLPDALRSWWQHISDPSLWPNERLFFEVYVQALHGRPPTSELLDGIVDSWLDPAAETAEAMGVPHEQARAFARLGVAVTRGLLLDLLATKDRAGVDEAMELWIALNSHHIGTPPAPG
jgi:AcrR family transcriptional regulator